MRQIECASAQSAIHLAGLRKRPLQDITLEAVKINAEQEMIVRNVVGLRTDRLDIHIPDRKD